MNPPKRRPWMLLTVPLLLASVLVATLIFEVQRRHALRHPETSAGVADQGLAHGSPKDREGARPAAYGQQTPPPLPALPTAPSAFMLRPPEPISRQRERLVSQLARSGMASPGQPWQRAARSVHTELASPPDGVLESKPSPLTCFREGCTFDLEAKEASAAAADRERLISSNILNSHPGVKFIGGIEPTTSGTSRATIILYAPGASPTLE